MIRYDFTDLSIFLTLARTGSLTKATETLPFTPSALSLRLRKLEDALGAKLFMREARGLALTPAGDVLVRHAQNVLKAAAQLETAMSGFDTKERRTLRIASNSTGLQNVIAPVAGGFLAGRRVRLVFLELRSHEAAEALSDGRADLAFGVEHIFRQSDLPIEVSPLFTDRHVVIVPKSHPLAQREAVRFADTLAYPYAACSKHTPITRAMVERAAQIGSVYDPIAEVPTFQLLLGFVAQGAGIAIVPKSSLWSAPEQALNLAAVNLLDDWADRPLAFAYLRDKPEYSDISAFIHYCEEACSERLLHHSPSHL